MMNKETNFELAYLTGSIGKAIIEAILHQFGYETYPYGYENILHNVIRSMKRGYDDTTAQKVIAMPDLFVYDREQKESFLLEIKSYNPPDESHCLIPKPDIDNYQKNWPEAILVIYCIQEKHIYCRKIGEIQTKNLSLSRFTHPPKPAYVLNLVGGDFQPLETYFSRIKLKEYNDFCKRIRENIAQFST
jgi:hypothetical protein